MGIGPVQSNHLHKTHKTQIYCVTRRELGFI